MNWKAIYHYNEPAELGVVGHVDHTHAATTDLPL
jgi:hypothetical protein